ncbi:MAG: four helix bundle protein [Chloroflexi bacterium]|nr:four helix bundle protein [Chloroflexota bacterium]
MTAIERFEDIKAWQKARDVAKQIYNMTCRENFAKDYSLKDQIRRASVSIMSNIAEGYARQTDKEFIQFLHVALGSVAEVQSQLYIAKDLDYISNGQFKQIHELSSETAKLINGFIKYLRQSAVNSQKSTVNKEGKDKSESDN